jgi:hypothetical protein
MLADYFEQDHLKIKTTATSEYYEFLENLPAVPL